MMVVLIGSAARPPAPTRGGVSVSDGSGVFMLASRAGIMGRRGLGFLWKLCFHGKSFYLVSFIWDFFGEPMAIRGTEASLPLLPVAALEMDISKFWKLPCTCRHVVL